MLFMKISSSFFFFFWLQNNELWPFVVSRSLWPIDLMEKRRKLSGLNLCFLSELINSFF